MPRQDSSQDSPQGSSFFGLRSHRVAIALIAILITVALASNYYLW